MVTSVIKSDEASNLSRVIKKRRLKSKRKRKGEHDVHRRDERLKDRESDLRRRKDALVIAEHKSKEMKKKDVTNGSNSAWHRAHGQVNGVACLHLGSERKTEQLVSRLSTRNNVKCARSASCVAHVQLR